MNVADAIEKKTILDDALRYCGYILGDLNKLKDYQFESKYMSELASKLQDDIEVLEKKLTETKLA